MLYNKLALECAVHFAAAAAATRARPEVMTIGLKAVRELSLRCPLVMTEELLQVSEGPTNSGGHCMSSTTLAYSLLLAWLMLLLPLAG